MKFGVDSEPYLTVCRKSQSAGIFLFGNWIESKRERERFAFIETWFFCGWEYLWWLSMPCRIRNNIWTIIIWNHDFWITVMKKDTVEYCCSSWTACLSFLCCLLCTLPASNFNMNNFNHFGTDVPYEVLCLLHFLVAFHFLFSMLTPFSV
jgi:hypothetical protein